MLLHLIRSQQLKKKTKAIIDDQLVLVMPDGKVLQPILTDGTKNAFNGIAIVFDVPEIAPVMETDFSKLEAAIAKKKLGGVNNVCAVLRRAQSVTIQYVSNTLDIPRETAKQLLDMLVASGAYTKYYSYWRRTAAFSAWLENRKEKV